MNYALITACAEEAEEIDEEVDKVEIERQGADSGDFIDFFDWSILCHTFDFLGVPCSDTDENQHADAWYYPFECAALHKQIDDDADDESEECHIKICANLREVAVGKVTIDAHRTKNACRNQEGLEDWGLGVNGENQREGDAVEDGEKIEE